MSWPREEPLKPSPSSRAEPQLAPERCGAEPSFKCLHLVPPTFMVALGVVRIRTQWKLLGHLTLYFLGSKCLNSAPVLLTVQNFTFENRSKRRHAERGRGRPCCLMRGDERPHTPTMLLGALPIKATFPSLQPEFPLHNMMMGASTPMNKLILSFLTF